MRGARGGPFAGKAGYMASCLLAVVLMVVSGYAYKVTGLVGAIGGGVALPDASSTGAMNILLMGLESRTDYEGQTLSSQLLTAMHAGSVNGVNNQGVGGQDTNTLILIHIFAGGQRAVGYSIPRDDWVTYPRPYDGQSQGKIDQAYGLAYAQSLSATVSSHMTSKQRYHLANDAGQYAEIDTVESVTGQSVSHFAEVNLAGFFYLAQAFGGIEVCVKPYNGGTNLQDANSGFDAVRYDGYRRKKGGSQYLHLAADQALAFVRERDNLPNGDLDRTHRQQAVLDYVIWKLKTQGILSDLSQLTALLGTAKLYVLTDRYWNLLDFSTQMHALSGEHLKFYTAPIAGYQTIDGEDANKIDLATVRAAIKAKFDPPAAVASSGNKAAAKAKSGRKAVRRPAASTVTVDVYNGGATGGLASGVSGALATRGYKAGLVTNATAAQHVGPGTQVLYGAGAAANAARIAKWFGATAKARKSVKAGHVQVVLGTGSTVVPAGLAGRPAAASAAATPSAASTSAGNNGASGGAVSVSAKARYGIPCVY